MAYRALMCVFSIPAALPNADKNNDGSISVEELEASLRHVAVKCPTTRCIYRCNRKVAHELFERIAGQGER